MELAPHVTNLGFGLNVDYTEHLIRCLEATKYVRDKPASSDIQLWLRYRYETDYGVYNHELPPVPDQGLDLFLAHPMEDTYKHGPLYDRIVKFHERRVHQRFGITFTELLSMPREAVVHILEICGKPPEAELRIITEMESTFGKTRDQIRQKGAT